MANTFIIKEDVLNEVEQIMKPTESQFNSNVRYFLHQLLDDPVNAEIPTCIRMANISRSRFIKMLIDRGIVTRSEKLNDTDKDGNRKTPTMSVKYKVIGKVPDELEYKVSKTDFDRKIEKLRRSIFEKNLPQKKFNTPLGDELAIAKNSPATMGFIAPAGPGTWLANKAAEAYNAQLHEGEIDEDGGGAGSADASGQFSQPLFGMIRRKINERLNTNPEFSSRYRDLGGGFDVQLENGAIEKSLVTIQNKSTNALYHICFDGANFNIYRDMRDGQPCSHVSYVFDKLLDAFDNNGYVNINETDVKPAGRVFKISEEQAKAIEEATATTTVGDYTYDVPFGVNPSDETMKRHNGEGGSVSINHVNESNRESLHTANVGDYINDNPIGIHPEDPSMKRGEGKHGSHSIERVNEAKNDNVVNINETKKSWRNNPLFTIGKYKGSEKNKIINENPEYCLWLHENTMRRIGNTPFSPKELALLDIAYYKKHKEFPIRSPFTPKYAKINGKYVNRMTKEELDYVYEHGNEAFKWLVRQEHKNRGLIRRNKNKNGYRIHAMGAPAFQTDDVGDDAWMNNMNESKKKTHEDWMEEHDIKEEECGLGFSEKEQKWYGWSHRGACGFGIGDKFRECYPTGTKIGKIIKTLEQAKEAAKKFAESVS